MYNEQNSAGDIVDLADAPIKTLKLGFPLCVEQQYDIRLNCDNFPHYQQLEDRTVSSDRIYYTVVKSFECSKRGVT